MSQVSLNCFISAYENNINHNIMSETDDRTLAKELRRSQGNTSSW